MSSGMVSHKYLNHNEPISALFTSSNISDLGYLAIVSKYRFTIYFVQDDNNGSCETSMVWDKDYRFDKSLTQMGLILSLDFEKSCLTFVTGTHLGWILIWNLKDKQLIRRFRV